MTPFLRTKEQSSRIARATRIETVLKFLKARRELLEDSLLVISYVYTCLANERNIANSFVQVRERKEIWKDVSFTSIATRKNYIKFCFCPIDRPIPGTIESSCFVSLVFPTR